MIKYPESIARTHLARAHGFTRLYVAMLLLAFQGAVTLYVHSTYVATFVDARTVGVLFMLGAALTIASLCCIEIPLQRFGNLTCALVLIGIDAFALLGMALPYGIVVVPLFVLHQAVAPLIFFTLDIFLEGMTGLKEGQTGARRGIVLALMSGANALAPLIAGLTMDGSHTPNFGIVYAASAVLLLPLAAYLHLNFRDFKDPRYTDFTPKASARVFWRDKNLRNVFSAHFLLQLFFTWMVIYAPLYLATTIGLTWEQIGLVLFVGLLAYVLLEYPVGIIADRWLGEQEMMAVGFLILALSTAWLSFIATAALVPWMVATFMTRVGAAFVETTTESYFFKHADGRDANLIGLFRVTRPLSVFVGALLGSIVLVFLPLQYMFVALGILLSSGVVFSLFLLDTR